MEREFGFSSNIHKIIFPILDRFIKDNINKLMTFKSLHKVFTISNETYETINVNKFYLLLIIESFIENIIINSSKRKDSLNSVEIIKNFLDSEVFFSMSLKSQIQPEIEILDYNNPILKCLTIINDKLLQFKSFIIQDDLFGHLYQNLVETDIRHDKGEYYTPNWLIRKILDDLWPIFVKLKFDNKKVKVLDPSCGSGSFLTQFVIKGLKENFFISYEDIFSTINGFDINDYSVFMTKVNIALNIISLANFKSKSEFMIKNDSFSTIDTLLINSTKNELIEFIEKKSRFEDKKKVDFIIGNPPWITLKAIKDKNYQERVKNEFFKYKLVKKSETHLFTQLEVASLFYNKCVDIYLKEGGLISFVMPKSVILGTTHNKWFQEFNHPKSKLIKIWDLQDVSNLFGMPSCVLFGLKGEKTIYPVELIQFKENNNPGNNLGTFTLLKSTYNRPYIKSEKSFYYSKFKVGASIFPRNLYFVEILKYLRNSVQVITDPAIEKIAKDQWKNISLRGNIDKKFLYQTLLAWELVPFGYTRLRDIVLPVNILNNKIIIIQSNDLIGENKKWFNETNRIWKQKSTDKSKLRFPKLIDRLNYNNLLIKQELKNYIVLFSGTGTNICSCVLKRILNSKNSTHSDFFIPDVKTWTYETDNEMEAYYLSAVLNSAYLNELIKPLQPQGLGGGRAIHRRPLEFPIPKFANENSIHCSLAKLSKEAHELINSKVKNNEIKTRKHARIFTKKELDLINELVKLLLKDLMD